MFDISSKNCSNEDILDHSRTNLFWSSVHACQSSSQIGFYIASLGWLPGYSTLLFQDTKLCSGCRIVCSDPCHCSSSWNCQWWRHLDWASAQSWNQIQTGFPDSAADCLWILRWHRTKRSNLGAFFQISLWLSLLFSYGLRLWWVAPQHLPASRIKTRSQLYLDSSFWCHIRIPGAYCRYTVYCKQIRPSVLIFENYK